MDSDGHRRGARRGSIPWRAIFAVIGAVVVTVIALDLIWHVRRVLIWIVVAAFFAVVLDPPVSWTQRRLKVRRGLAVFVIVGLAFIAVSAIGYVAVRPLISEIDNLPQTLPRYVEDAQNGRGNIGHLTHELKLDSWLRDHADDIEQNLTANGRPVEIARTVGNAILAMVTIFVLTVLMLLEGPDIVSAGLSALSPQTQARVSTVSGDAARAVTGYVAGNLLISVIAGLVTYVTLLALGVPFAGPLAVWVGVADLIPLVGATLGAAPAVLVAALHSVTAGIITLVVFIVYQQFENHVLQVSIMAKTVALKPFVVLVSVLLGVELLGFVGALLAIPVAGVLQVVSRDLWDNRSRKPKRRPTVGAEERPTIPGG